MPAAQDEFVARFARLATPTIANALDDIAFADIDLLSEAGALDPATSGKLICDVESVPPVLVIRRLSRLH